MVIEPWRAPWGPPVTGASNTHQEPGADGEDSPGICRSKRGVHEDGQGPLSVVLQRLEHRRDLVRQPHRDVELSTDGQSAAARSLPAGDAVSSDHSRIRSGLRS